jgi:hypothetical protein
MLVMSRPLPLRRNDGSKRHHGRRKSAQPPDSYGLHGHGVHPADKFEKAWYDKHPDALLREEHGQYSPALSNGRGEWALSSEDLNKIVRDTKSRGSGFGNFDASHVIRNANIKN